MGLAGCGKIIKILMIVANILILIGGISVFGVGVWTCTEKAQMEKLYGNNLFMSAAYIMIVTGILVVIISFIGCLGAWLENKCLLVLYFIILFIIFVLMIVAGVLGYVFKEEVSTEFKSRMVATLDDYTKNKDTKDMWDYIQKEYKCCGVNKGEEGPRDWNGKLTDIDSNAQFPASCCEKTRIGVPQLDSSCTVENGFAYQRGCYNAVLDATKGHAMVVGGVGVGIACVLLLGMIFSIILCMTIQ